MATVFTIDAGGHYRPFGAGEGIDPIIPDGNLLIDAPPENGLDILTGFTVSDGRAVGGTWDTSARAPDVPGFLLALKGAAGGVVAANALATKYPNIALALSLGAWADAATLFTVAHGAGDLTDDEFTAVAALAASHHIPLS